MMITMWMIVLGYLRKCLQTTVKQTDYDYMRQIERSRVAYVLSMGIEQC